jgi:uncharacterized membrane protein YgaE (UPF0421/DUF939 family)
VSAVRVLLARRVGRLRTSALPVLQCALAAALAWFVATEVVGHARPFFAPVAAIVCLGVSLGAKLRRTVELVVGVSVGILVADLFVTLIGTGAWQIGLVVLLAMSTAVLLDGGPVLTLQAGSSAVLVATLLPPGQSGGPERALDALVGGIVAIVVVAVVPADPLRAARRDGSAVLTALAQALRGVADGLAEEDPAPVGAALTRARGTQVTLDALRADLVSGREIARIAPLRWRSRAGVVRLAAMVEPIDNAARNVRVLARRALVVVGDQEPVDPRIVLRLVELAAAVEVLREVVGSEPGSAPSRADVATALRGVARGLTADLGADGGLSVRVVVAQLRSTVVDLMQAAGASRISALAMLPPTVQHPAVAPYLDD